MKRRGFLKTLFGAAATLPIVVVKEKVKADEPTYTETDKTSLIELHDAGLVSDQTLLEEGHCGYCYDGPPSPAHPSDPDSYGCEYRPRAGLKPDRIIYRIDVCHFCDEVAQQGMVVEYVDAHIVRPGHHSGCPAGVLLENVVGIDFRQHPAYQDTAVGGKVTVCFDGEIRTIVNGYVQIGMKVYYDYAGYLTTEEQTDAPPIGTALSCKDDDGYAKVRVHVWR